MSFSFYGHWCFFHCRDLLQLVKLLFVSADRRVTNEEITVCSLENLGQETEQTVRYIDGLSCVTHLSPQAILCFNMQISLLPPAVDKRCVVHRAPVGCNL